MGCVAECRWRKQKKGARGRGAAIGAFGGCSKGVDIVNASFLCPRNPLRTCPAAWEDAASHLVMRPRDASLDCESLEVSSSKSLELKT